MSKSLSNEGCHCRNKSRPNILNMQMKYQCEKLCDNKFKNIRTQTETDPDLKAQEQIAELLTEIAVTLNQKSKLESELCSLQSIVAKSEETYNTEKLKIDEEVIKLSEANLEKENLLSNLKITHLEEQKALLSQINELKSELHILKEQKEQDQHDISTSTVLLDHKLNAALLELKNEQDKNELFVSKINKYKNKIRYLTKYIKQLIEEINSLKTKKDQGDVSEYKKSLSLGRQKSLSHDNITSTQSISKKYEPDIENMILSELFFKPNPVPNDVVSLFFCSTDGSQQ